MVFFNADNPIALLLAGVVVFLVLRVVLSKFLGKSKFGKKHADFVSAIVAVLCLLMVTSMDFLRMVSYSIPWLALIFIMLMLAVLVYLAFGVNPDKVPIALKKIGGHANMVILLTLVIIWGGSMIWGQPLLEEQPSTTITGFSAAEQEQVDNYDFGFIFTKAFLGFAFVFIIIGYAFHIVTKTAT